MGVAQSPPSSEVTIRYRVRAVTESGYQCKEDGTWSAQLVLSAPPRVRLSQPAGEPWPCLPWGLAGNRTLDVLLNLPPPGELAGGSWTVSVDGLTLPFSGELLRIADLGGVSGLELRPPQIPGGPPVDAKVVLDVAGL